MMITTLNQSKKILRKPRNLVASLFKNEIKDIDRLVNAEVAKTINTYRSEFTQTKELSPKRVGGFSRWSKDLDYRNSLRDFLMDLIRLKVNPFENDEIANSIIRIHRLKDRWIQPPDAWKKKSHNDRKQIISLVRHLFCRYPNVPTFMDNVWFGDSTPLPVIEWYIFLGRGGNIRKAEEFPIKNYTKKMAHHFLNAPGDYTVLEAIYWGYIHGLGGTERLVRSMCGTFVGESFENFDFWGTVIHWFVNNPMLDHMKVQPICDYLRHMKFEIQRLGVQQPLIPDFSMKGRTVEALLRDVDRWHALTQVGGRRGRPITTWYPLPIKDFIHTEGRDSRKKVWQINQLLNSKELAAEGRALRHCVGSYAGSCAAGRNSIFSLNMSDKFNDGQKMLTIEVSMDRRIGQIQGKNNNLRPTPKHMAIINRWAEKENLTVSRWV